jgi:hypothetical protein
MEQCLTMPRFRAVSGGVPFRGLRQVQGRQQVLEVAASAPAGLAPGVVRRASDVEQATQTVAPPPPVKPAPSLNALDFCREARRLRAVFEDEPVRMHQELGKLAIVAPQKRKATPLRSLAQTAKLGKRGMSLLKRLGWGMGATAGGEEDEQPRVTLVDSADPGPMAAEGAGSDGSFGQLVLRQLKGRRWAGLRYSERLALLKEAGRRGIGRFEANLIIASVQHRLSGKTPGTEERKPFRFGGTVAFLVVQGLILLGVWMALRG